MCITRDSSRRCHPLAIIGSLSWWLSSISLLLEGFSILDMQVTLSAPQGILCHTERGLNGTRPIWLLINNTLSQSTSF